MKRMSFALTTFQLMHEIKIVTRRKGWSNLKPGEMVMGVKKCMGLKKGEKQQILRPLVCVSNQPEQVEDVFVNPVRDPRGTEAELEGFHHWSCHRFYKHLLKKAKVKPGETINRIEFQYADA